jgi:transcriptional regulator of acetoin/glycerol metabolism
MHEEHSASTALSSAGQDNDRLTYSVAEAARRLDVSRMTLYRLYATKRG